MKYNQSFFKALGEYGCYALCIINIAEQIAGKPYDTIGVLEEAIKKGYIEWHEDNYAHKDNFYVEKPDKFLEMMTGRKWNIRKEYDILYQAKPGEYIVERWERNGYGHFARTRDGYNSLQDSKCVSLGSLASLRVFKEIK